LQERPRFSIALPDPVSAGRECVAVAGCVRRRLDGADAIDDNNLDVCLAKDCGWHVGWPDNPHRFAAACVAKSVDVHSGRLCDYNIVDRDFVLGKQNDDDSAGSGNSIGPPCIFAVQEKPV